MPKLRVLVADDHRAVRLAMTRLLEGEFEVIGSATDGRDLIDAAMTLHPDVIATDIFMPFLTGPQAMEVVRATGLHIPFVLVSTDPTGMEEYFEAGALGFVHKMDMAYELAPAIAAASRGEAYVSRAAIHEVSVQCKAAAR